MPLHEAILMPRQSETQEWLNSRREYLGGSDAAAALGLSKWKTPYQLWEEKRGLSSPEPENWEMSRGKALEPLLRQHYSNTTDRIVSLPKDAMIHAKYPWMRYNPDGIALDDARLCEFKTAAYGKEWGEPGSDEIPQEYLLQVQHGMAVTGLPITDVTVSVAGNEPRYFEVEADKELQQMLIDQEHCFWQKVISGEAPEPVNVDDLLLMHKIILKSSIDAEPHIVEILQELKGLKEEIKDQEVRKGALEFHVKDFMGAHEALVDKTGTIIATWKGTKEIERFKKDEFKKLVPEMYARFVEYGAPQRRFLVK